MHDYHFVHVGYVLATQTYETFGVALVLHYPIGFSANKSYNICPI